MCLVFGCYPVRILTGAATAITAIPDRQFQSSPCTRVQPLPSTRHSAIRYCTNIICGPGSSVGIATDYGLDGPTIESRWGRDFLPVETGPGAHQTSCKMGTRSFPGVKCGRDVLLTTHPLLVPRSRKSRAIPLPTL